MSFTPHLSCICHLFSRFSCYLLDSGLIILISIVFFSLFLISRHSAVSVHPFYSLFFFFHFYPPFSISNPLSSFICPSVPPLEKVTFAVKCSSPPLYHTVKKMPWHYVPGGHSIDFSSHVSRLPLFLFLLLLWLPLSPGLRLSPIPSHPSLPQRPGSPSDSLSVVPFHATHWLALHYSANILHLFHTPTHSRMCTYIQTDLFHPPIRLTALLKLPRT